MAAVSTRVGRYELQEELGRGGAGIVYRARDTQLGRDVAIKLLLGLAGAEERLRFLREGRAVSVLRHAHLLDVYDLGEDEGRLYLVQQLALGGSLAGSLRTGGPWSEPEVVELGAKLASALAAAHAAGVLHRDLKPANVLIDGEGEPRLADFGLARPLAQGESLTETGTVLGTPSYMSPEQARGETTSPLSDVYGLGALLYAMLTGQPPFSASTTLATLVAVTTQPVQAPRDRRPELSPELNGLLLRCLAKEPKERPASAEVLGEELARLAARSSQEPPTDRSTILLAALGLALALIGGAVGGRYLPGAGEHVGQEGATPQVDTSPGAASATFERVLGQAAERFEARSYEEAEGFARQAAALRPEDARAQVLLAKVALQAGRWEEVDTIAAALSAADPRAAALLRAELAIKRQQPELALSSARLARTLGGESAKARAWEAVALFALKRHQEAGRLLDEALQRFPNDPDLTFLAGQYRIRVGDLERGRTLLSRAIELNEQHVAAHLYRARTWADPGRMKQDLDRVLEIDSTHVEALVLRASARRGLDDREGARADVLVAMRVRLQSLDQRTRRVELLVRSGFPHQALEASEELIEDLDQGSAELWRRALYARGQAFLTLQDAQRALTVFDELEGRGDFRASAFFHAGLLQRAGQLQRALARVEGYLAKGEGESQKAARRLREQVLSELGSAGRRD